MRTLDASWTGSLRVVGDLERPDHPYLRPSDQCYFLGEYAAGEGWQHSVTNQHIWNLKKSPQRRAFPDWQHKARAIQTIGQTFAANVRADHLPHMTFVPIPPSKTRKHPEFDDRVEQIARAIGANADVRELLVGVVERIPVHVGQQRRDQKALRNSLSVKTEFLEPRRGIIVLLDDVLTTGCSFVVCKQMLEERMPGAQIIGMFVARRAVPRPVL